MAEDMVRVRVKRCGDLKINPEWWQFMFEDADTGKMLPVTDFKLVGGFNGGKDFLMAEVTLYIHEIEIEMPIVARKERRCQYCGCGRSVEITADEDAE